MKFKEYLLESNDKIKQAIKLAHYKIFYDIDPQLDSRLNVRDPLAKMYSKEATKAFMKLSNKEKKEFHKIKDSFKKYKPQQLKKELEKYIGYTAENDPNDPLND